MAYQIDRYNNTILAVVEDGTIDTTTDLKFIGKNYAGYGEIQNENFLYLLENFSGANPPPRALSGQAWFDSANSKFKFYDGDKWRTTGGAEVADAEPTGLATGDFWWDSLNDQLYVYNGTRFILIGPQNAGEGVTAMLSTTLLDVSSNPHVVILAYVNDEVIYVISGDQFDIGPANPLTGFDRIKQGLTLVNTTLATGGVTSSAHRYWGTASNADRLGGIEAGDFVQKINPEFNVKAKFVDAGISIGGSAGAYSEDLKVYMDRVAGATLNHGIIQHDVGASTNISFKANDNLGVIQTVLSVGTTSGTKQGIAPGVDNTMLLGTGTKRWQNVYAAAFTGMASESQQLKYDGSDANLATGSTDSDPLTVAVRDAAGDIYANLFQGTATSARYADLAEKYSTCCELPVGTAVEVSVDEDSEVAPAKASSICIGVVSDAPAYLMNSEAEGQAIGLKGRVPVRVTGPVKKGEAVYAWNDGVCRTIQTAALVGVALETNSDEGEKLVECVLKV